MLKLISRRRALTLGAVGLLAAGGLGGCTGDETPAAPVALSADELAVNRAIAAARARQADALALAAARPSLATLLRRVAGVHAQHLVALGAPATATATPTPSATAGTDPAPSSTRLIKAEAAAARAALRDGEAAAPAFAVLLVRIAAARIVNADLVSAAVSGRPPGELKPAAAPSTSATPSTPSTPSAVPTTIAPDPTPSDLGDAGTPALTALNRLLAGEHAAVFAYPLVIARAESSRRSLASALWQLHRTERDELTALLLAAGVRPAVAEPAYTVGTPPGSAAKAAALAARVERGLAALATDLLAAGAAGDRYRVLGADQLVLAARRTAGWAGKPIAFPGLINRATATATATP